MYLILLMRLFYCIFFLIGIIPEDKIFTGEEIVEDDQGDGEGTISLIEDDFWMDFDSQHSGL